MRIGQLNIRRGLAKKIDAIEKIICDYNFQIMGLTESDLDEHDTPPTLEGFICLESNDPKRRVCTYVSDELQFETIHYTGDLPCVVFHLAQCTVAFIYSQFMKNKISQTEKMRRDDVMDFLHRFAGVARSRASLHGDFNVDWTSSSITKNMIIAWSKDNDFQQLIKAPTRKSINNQGLKTNPLEFVPPHPVFYSRGS